MSPDPTPIVSHGRGGAGNIAPDAHSYTDGEIVRSGAQGDQGDGAYSAGRGGAGNINSPGLRATKGKVAGDADVVPESAVRVGEGERERFHVGRGGEGNVMGEKEKEGGVLGKVERKVEGVLGRKREGE